MSAAMFNAGWVLGMAYWWWIQTLLTFDQTVNVVFFFGDADETISARLFRQREDARRYRAMERCVNALFFWQDGHCHLAYLEEVNRRQISSHYRQFIK